MIPVLVFILYIVRDHSFGTMVDSFCEFGLRMTGGNQLLYNAPLSADSPSLLTHGAVITILPHILSQLRPEGDIQYLTKGLHPPEVTTPRVVMGKLEEPLP